jgi:hypothetical protein
LSCRAAFSSFDQSDHFAPIEPIQRGNEVPIVEHVDQPIDWINGTREPGPM